MSQLRTFPVASCTECGLEAGGRCPTCRRRLCVDHFGLSEHAPCAQRHAERPDEHLCYVCGVPVHPQQWSTSIFAHYTDASMCHGCRRYICDEQHTRLRDETVEIVRDGLRSHRYHVTRRYCGLCAPLRRVGGLRGASWWVVGLGALGVAAAFIVQH